MIKIPLSKFCKDKNFRSELYHTEISFLCKSCKKERTGYRRLCFNSSYCIDCDKRTQFTWWLESYRLFRRKERLKEIKERTNASDIR